LSSFFLITCGFAIFWRQNIGKKCLHKMLMKLTQGVPHNFQKTAPEIQNLEINKKINFLQIRKLAKK